MCPQNAKIHITVRPHSWRRGTGVGHRHPHRGALGRIEQLNLLHLLSAATKRKQLQRYRIQSQHHTRATQNSARHNDIHDVSHLAKRRSHVLRKTRKPRFAADFGSSLVHSAAIDAHTHDGVDNTIPGRRCLTESDSIKDCGIVRIRRNGRIDKKRLGVACHVIGKIIVKVNLTGRDCSWQSEVVSEQHRSAGPSKIYSLSRGICSYQNGLVHGSPYGNGSKAVFGLLRPYLHPAQECFEHV